MNTRFSENLKALRISKKLTQEQVAERLNVSSQAVSRWECGTGTPDIMLLPDIAKLYCVTVDDLYKEQTVAYENYAQRLASMYEYTRKPEDFLEAELEFCKLVNSGQASLEDLRSYGVIHHYMMNYCKNKALELFERVLRSSEEKAEVTYSKAKAQKIELLCQTGEGEKAIAEQLQLIENGVKNPVEYALLLHALVQMEKFDMAYEWFEKSFALFPKDWSITVWGGNICEEMGRYEEAFKYWDKALELDENWIDPLYSKAFCYEKLDEKEKAYTCWCEIEEWLNKRGLEYEAEQARDNMKRINSR